MRNCHHCPAVALMASGRTHARVAAIVGVSVLLATPVTAQSFGVDCAAGSAAGALAGYLVTPDIDLITLTREERRMRKRVPVFGRLWVAYWAAYGSFFTHRGVSHWPIIGTMTRAAYAFWWVPLMFDPMPVSQSFVVAMFASWALQDFFHLAFDKFGIRWRI